MPGGPLGAQLRGRPRAAACSSTGAGAPVSGVGAGGRLREGDHVADRVGAGQPLDDPVEPVGDAAVRRRAVAQRLEQEAEARLRLLRVDPERGEQPCRCSSESLIRIEPPPISWPFQTTS